MAIIALVVYVFLAVLLAHQWVIAHERYKFERRLSHGRRVWYVRSRKTGRVIAHARGFWDIVGLGV